MVTKVVVALDGSEVAERAIGPGRALAERSGASLVLLTSCRGDEVEAAGRYLEQTAAKLEYARVETKLIHDRLAAAAILTETGAPGTVVSMATHGRSGIGEVLLGSVAEEVLRRSECPVLLAGPALDRTSSQSEQWFAGGKLLVTIDGSEASKAVIPIAAEWCDVLGLEPWVVGVVVVAGGMALELGTDETSDTTVRRIAMSLTDEPETTNWEVLHDRDVVASILDCADRLPAALIAMGTHGRAGLARVALGSVAMQVVHRSRCPVVVTRSRLSLDERTDDGTIAQ